MTEELHIRLPDGALREWDYEQSSLQVLFRDPRMLVLEARSTGEGTSVIRPRLFSDLKYLSLFFIPITVAVITFKSQLSANWQIITFTLIASTVLSLILTAIIANKMLAKSA